ncbi:hypothetical protein [Streptomyces sp. 35G-GA-8]|uniref:hypothetical protein n=1 Tax=Streptomyces sp. 35G-GA-8 TaxID=2939434 RepID=UPI00201ECEB6|nr:hypothetical protein [Streptomyces sp. 35G-GA-8]MCL7381521.1 hypothetical protein [Streptomyces sp. 35G-GA-8]
MSCAGPRTTPAPGTESTPCSSGPGCSRSCPPRSPARVAFDLYRGLLLDTARHGGRPPLPEAGPAERQQQQQPPAPAPGTLSSAAERELWEGLCGFWYRNIPVEARITAPRSGG